MTIKRKVGRPKNKEKRKGITLMMPESLYNKIRKKFKRGELSSLGKAWLESLVKK